MKLTRNFFEQPTLTVAQQLLGKTLVFKEHTGIITETEAYIGQDDPACHAARGITPRTKPMFGPAGYSYVYFIYGMYFCLNIVTEKEGFGASVLIRGLQLPTHTLNGPGKLCRHLGITTAHNNLDLIESDDFYVKQGLENVKFSATPRIGISKGQDKLWRFVIQNQKTTIQL